MASKFRFAVAVLAFCGMAGVSIHDAASATDVTRDNYVKFQAGAFFPTGDMDDYDFDTGFESAITYGRYLNEFLVFEAGLDFFIADNDVRGKGKSGGFYKQDNSLSVGALSVNLIGEMPAGPLDLYAGAGVGFYFATLYSDTNISWLGSFDTDESDVVFGGQFVVGANYNFNEHFFAGVEGSYRITDDLDISDYIADVPVRYNGDLSGFSLLGTFGFRF